MTPEKRLNQIEPEIADLHLKTDRLIDTTGKILSDVVRIENKLDFVDSKVDRVDSKVDQLDSRVRQLDNKVDIVATGLAKLTVDVAGLRQEIQDGFSNVNQRFERVENTQQEILIFLRERLG